MRNQKKERLSGARRKRLLAQAFCRHSIQYEGAHAPSYSPCETVLLFFNQKFFGKLKRAPCQALFSGHLMGMVMRVVSAVVWE